MTEKIAKAVRVLSVPPVMALALALIVYFHKNGVMDNQDLVLTVIFLTVVPLLAYPVAALIPRLRAKGREGQRNFAFALTAVSYPFLVLYAVWSKGSDNFQLIAWTYLLTLAVLLVLNKGLKLRASGHAASTAGPLIVICYFFGLKGVVAGIMVYALILWASLALKRHTPRELWWGTLASAAAFGLALLIVALF